MITRLRHRHRWMAPGSISLALVGLAVAASQRPVAFVESALPTPEDTVPAADGPRFRVSLEGASNGARTLRIEPVRLVGSPDLLAYLVKEPSPPDGVPEGALLLGQVDPQRATQFGLPADATLDGNTSVLLYSLGHAERVGVVSVPEPR